MGTYADYIGSGRWRTSAARAAEMEAAGRRCRLCNVSDSEARLELHHRTYVRLGCELPEDLTLLCSSCHRAVTDHLRRRRYAARRLLPIETPDRDSCFGALSDPMARS